MTKDAIGRLLREVRERAGLTPRQIADLLDVRQTTVSAWETAISEPSLATIYAWAEACGQRAELAIRRLDGADPLSPLLDAARALSPEQLARLERDGVAAHARPANSTAHQTSRRRHPVRPSTRLMTSACRTWSRSIRPPCP